MDIDRLRKIIDEVRVGNLATDEALERLRDLPYEDLGFAKVDHYRSLQKGFPEVVFCPGKTTDQVVEIMKRLCANHTNVMATRASREAFEAVREDIPDARYYDSARIIVMSREALPKSPGTILVVSAGTADLPVAEEAAVTAEVLGNEVDRLYDVGVAGLHRLLDRRKKLFFANVIIVVAGMEGALASVVGGMVAKPVIAVPTSVGYGASFHGLAALLSMLNSCAAGIGVVNIDNGFGAGCLASMINKMNMNMNMNSE